MFSQSKMNEQPAMTKFKSKLSVLPLGYMMVDDQEVVLKSTQNGQPEKIGPKRKLSVLSKSFWTISDQSSLVKPQNNQPLVDGFKSSLLSHATCCGMTNDRISGKTLQQATCNDWTEVQSFSLASKLQEVQQKLTPVRTYENDNCWYTKMTERYRTMLNPQSKDKLPVLRTSTKNLQRPKKIPAADAPVSIQEGQEESLFSKRDRFHSK